MTVREIREFYKEQTGEVHIPVTDESYRMWLEVTLAEKWTEVKNLYRQNEIRWGLL